MSAILAVLAVLCPPDGRELSLCHFSPECSNQTARTSRTAPNLAETPSRLAQLRAFIEVRIV